MSVRRTPAPLFRRACSPTGLVLAVVAVLIPFVALLSHQLDNLALISLPLAVIAARMERDARRQQHG
ncbi:MAG TPA: hypothetical protein VGE00_02750 [Gammaproteobacteria bacterium]